MRTKDVKYWVNQIIGLNNEQPRSREEEANYAIAELLIDRKTNSKMEAA